MQLKGGLGNDLSGKSWGTRTLPWDSSRSMAAMEPETSKVALVLSHEGSIGSGEDFPEIGLHEGCSICRSP